MYIFRRVNLSCHAVSFLHEASVAWSYDKNGADKIRTFASVFLLYLAALTRSNRKVMAHHMSVHVVTTHRSSKPRVACGLSCAGFLWYVQINYAEC